ncbi:MAG: PD40 domain-containing protein [Mariniphaga sp.]|nr:PD40 domain-containing protein [Mariniphaga sp.]
MNIVTGTFQRFTFQVSRIIFSLIIVLMLSSSVFAQGTRLLRQPSLSSTHIAYSYGADIWVTNLNTQITVRLTSTPAVESNPHFSPDGKLIAFTSNRSGSNAVYTVPVEGGSATRITWHPSSSNVRGWTPDGKQILYSSSRETAPSGHERLWTVSAEGGPSTLIAKQWGTDGSFSPDGKQIVVDRVSRWDEEWRAYRGGQNTPLVVMNLEDFSETLIPNKRSTDIQPLWLGDKIYFLSDRDWCMNIWAYSPESGSLNQITTFEDTDVKWLAGNTNKLAFERDGYLNILDIESGSINQLNITVIGDFPWAELQWENISGYARSTSLSTTGKRVIMESRGEIFTIPVEHGDTRNITKSSSAADRAPLWSPKGDQIAWFSDAGGEGYALLLASQDGLSEPKSISIGESKLAWEPTWSPDGKYIAFVDDDVRIRVVELESGNIQTVDVGGNNLERGGMGLTWSPDSKWLAYAKSASNNFRRITLWSLENKSIHSITNSFADSFSPAWDLDNKHFYFLASTELALGSGWANTSSMTSNPDYGAYIINLNKEDSSPFVPQSDEEEAVKDKEPKEDTDKKSDKKKKDDKQEKAEEVKDTLKIDFEGIERRTIALPMPVRSYQMAIAGPEGNVFIGESQANSRGLTLQKFNLKDREAKEFVSGASQVSVTKDAKKMLTRVGSNWKVMDATKPKDEGENVTVNLKMQLDRLVEWKQIFEEAWRYERDYFYDPDMHGRDWNVVYDRYAPLVPFVKHRADLTYILDQVDGELSVGHSFVGGGDYPSVESNTVGLLGADLIAENNCWKIKRIYTTESWNPGLSSPLDRPGIKAKEGNYIVGVNGKELTASDDPFKFLDGTSGVQTVIHLNDKLEFEGAWKETIEPIRSENALRQRAWVEDNRRLVDSLSNGRLAYVWVPNTGGGGFVSFNRYFFAQQDKEGAVIDERFNGGGLLDDYMVDLMTRSLRAGLTNEVPNGKAMRLPAGILGPKVLLINELSGSGGDFFPWVFRQQKVGPLIGTTTWGGLVKSSTHYLMVDGGRITAPDNAVFDPINNKWIAENEGVAPDIEVRQDAVSLSQGKDPQLERAVKELLKKLDQQPKIEITPPAFSTPAIKK